MKNNFKSKIAVDILMTLGLLLLMSYELVGDASHEWIGMGMFLLFVCHHILNRKWTGSVTRGRYTPLRVIQTILVVLLLLSMIGSMVSGIVLSNYVFKFVKIKGVANLARNIHMLCAYWGFLLMSVHLGFHWNMMIAMAAKALPVFFSTTWQSWGCLCFSPITVVNWLEIPITQRYKLKNKSKLL